MGMEIPFVLIFGLGFHPVQLIQGGEHCQQNADVAKTFRETQNKQMCGPAVEEWRSFEEREVFRKVQESRKDQEGGCGVEKAGDVNIA